MTPSVVLQLLSVVAFIVIFLREFLNADVNDNRKWKVTVSSAVILVLVNITTEVVKAVAEGRQERIAVQRAIEERNRAEELRNDVRLLGAEAAGSFQELEAAIQSLPRPLGKTVQSNVNDLEDRLKMFREKLSNDTLDPTTVSELRQTVKDLRVDVQALAVRTSAPSLRSDQIAEPVGQTLANQSMPNEIANTTFTEVAPPSMLPAGGSTRQTTMENPSVPLAGTTFVSFLPNEERSSSHERCSIDAAWKAYNLAVDYGVAIKSADRCIGELGKLADRQEAELESLGVPLPPTGTVSITAKNEILGRPILNDVGTAYYLKGRSAEILFRKGGQEAATYRLMATRAYQDACRLKYSRVWEPKGWFWSPCQASTDRIRLFK